MSHKDKFKNPEGVYFVSFATLQWIDVFVRKIYFDCIVNNLKSLFKFLKNEFQSTLTPPLKGANAR